MSELLVGRVCFQKGKELCFDLKCSLFYTNNSCLLADRRVATLSVLKLVITLPSLKMRFSSFSYVAANGSCAGNNLSVFKQGGLDTGIAPAERSASKLQFAPSVGQKGVEQLQSFPPSCSA